MENFTKLCRRDEGHQQVPTTYWGTWRFKVFTCKLTITLVFTCMYAHRAWAVLSRWGERLNENLMHVILRCTISFHLKIMLVGWTILNTISVVILKGEFYHCPYANLCMNKINKYDKQLRTVIINNTTLKKRRWKINSENSVIWQNKIWNLYTTLHLLMVDFIPVHIS